MAQGRHAPPPSCPVLTGVPVAGIAYLDRPQQAGYFIFPDLSVRHEGFYRLNFHLYEETKDSKDVTEGIPISKPTPNANLGKPSAPKSSLDFRLDVVSKQFQVYSAKKFPGLATSTNISRVIAEQGCRVRIRRDVRMRRRGDKRPGDYDFDEERMYRSSDRFSTPDSYCANPVERPRSTSISTVDPTFSYGPGIQRRPSATEYGFQPSQSYTRPMAPAPPRASPPTAAVPPPPSHSSAYSSHLAFGSTQTQYPAPHLPRTQSVTTPTSVFSPASISHTRTPSISTEYDGGSNGYSYPQPRVQTERSAYSTALPPLRLEPPRLEPPKTLNVQRSSEARSSDPNAYQSIIQPPAPRSQTPLAPSLPPLRSLSGEYPNNAPQPQNWVIQSPSSDLAAAKKLLWETNHSVSKRSYGDTFGHDERPLYNGMRPDPESYAPPSRSASDASRVSFYNDSRDEMAYKRANGRMATKISPALQ